MTYIAAPAVGVTVFDALAFPKPNRRIFRRLTIAFVATAAAWTIVISVILAATWMTAASRMVNSTKRADFALAFTPVAPASPVRADRYDAHSRVVEKSEPAGAVIDRAFRDLFVDPELDALRASTVPAPGDELLAPGPVANDVRAAAKPATPEAAPRAIDRPTSRPAIATRPPLAAAQSGLRAEQARAEPTAPAADSRTAIYDITARAVYLPNGTRLEAHSGLGNLMDNPRHVNVKNRGSTPPNVYDLKLREQLFHGVRAIRLTPVDNGKMFGRDGILAHSYMLGPDGQSNGCVSFSNYPAFLRAFMNGEIDRLVVVARLATPPGRANVAGRSPPDRYAAAGSRTTAR